MGGLGVGDLHIKNAALLFKWWWRFSESEDSLWKRVVCSINDLDVTKPLLTQEVKKSSSPWGQICSMQKWGIAVMEIIKRGFKKKIGNGMKTLFWWDVWIGDECLKNKFQDFFCFPIEK